MMRRILMLSTVHPATHPRYIIKLAASLGEAGHEVEVWARGSSAPEYLPGLKFHLVPPEGKLRRMCLLPSALFRAMNGGHDIIIVVPPETVPIGIAARLFGKRVIWDVEENAKATILSSDWIPRPLRLPIALVYSLVERLASATMSAVMLAEEDYLPSFRSSSRIEVIHNYPMRAESDLSRGEAARQRWSRPGPRLLYVGTVTWHRGLLEMIETVALLEDRLSDITLDIVGMIPRKEYRDKLSAAVVGLKRPKRVTIHGPVPFIKLHKHFKRAHIGLFPLYPLPNFTASKATKLFEYALAGLPTVVGDIPNWRFIIDETDAGETASPLDRKGWADAIERLWGRGPSELEAMGRRAHDHIVAREYFWDIEKRKLLSLCEELMKRPESA